MASATATPAPQPSATAFTKQAAGAFYLSAICPSNAAQDRVNVVVFGDPPRTAYFDRFSKEKLAKIRSAAKAAAVASRKAAGQVDSPPQKWPANVQKSVDRLVVELLDQFDWYSGVGKAKTTAALNRAWDAKFPDNKAAQLIRLRLGIPPAGKGCPKV